MDEVPALVTEALALAPAVSDLAIRAEVLYNVAAITCAGGRPDEGRPIADEAIATARASGDPWTIAMCAWARTFASADADEMRERIDEAAGLLEGAGNAFSLADTMSCMAVLLAWEIALTGPAAVAAVQDQPERAAQLAAEVTADRHRDDVLVRRLEADFLEPAGVRCGRG
jgi:hypothetical protein